MNKSVVLVIVSGFLLAGCGKKQEAAKEAPPPMPTLPYMNESKEGAPATPPPPGEAAPAQPQPDAGGAGEAPAEEGFPAETLNAAIQSFIEQFERPPQSLQELVDKQVLRRMPVPPAGKKFVYDSVKQKALIVNK